MPAHCVGSAPRNLVRDMADRIRANPRARALLRHAQCGDPSSLACAEPSGCDAAQLRRPDLAHFESAARALFAHQDFTAIVEFAPAIGPAAPDRYVITLRWRGPRDATDDRNAVALQVLAQSPVAG